MLFFIFFIGVFFVGDVLSNVGNCDFFQYQSFVGCYLLYYDINFVGDFGLEGFEQEFLGCGVLLEIIFVRYLESWEVYCCC